MARAHAPGYKALPDDVEMVWACDIVEEKARKIATEYGIPKVTTDYKDILNDPEIDAVSVMTQHRAHATDDRRVERGQARAVRKTPLDERRPVARDVRGGARQRQTAPGRSAAAVHKRRAVSQAVHLHWSPWRHLLRARAGAEAAWRSGLGRIHEQGAARRRAADRHRVPTFSTSPSR